MKTIAALGLVGALAFSGSQYLGMEPEIVVPDAADRTIRVVGQTGSVVVRGWDRPEVATEGAASDLEVSVTRNTISINPVSREREIVLLVPESSEIVVETRSGDIAVQRIHGSLIARSTSGDIALSDVDRSAVAFSRRGSVVVNGERIEGRTYAHSWNHSRTDWSQLSRDIEESAEAMAEHASEWAEEWADWSEEWAADWEVMAEDMADHYSYMSEEWADHFSEMAEDMADHYSRMAESWTVDQAAIVESVLNSVDVESIMQSVAESLSDIEITVRTGNHSHRIR